MKLLDEPEAGPLLHRERLWPSARGWAVTLGAPAVVGALFGLAGGPGVVAGMVVIGLVLGLVFAATGFVQEQRVHERALVTGGTWPRSRPYVIPWESVDPSQVRLHHRANLIGRRVKQGSRTLRVAPYGTIAVSFPGLAPELASPRARERTFGLLATQGVDAEAELRAQDESMRDWNLGTTYPTETWVIGTGHPDRFLAAVESALLAAGRPDARGLAARELAHPLVERYRHPLTEDELR